MAFPVEIISIVIERAVIGADWSCKLSIMLTNHLFLHIAQPLCYHSTTIPDDETASLFFKALKRCEARDSNYGPRASFIIHLRFAYEPRLHDQMYSKMIGKMCSLQSITTEFRDDHREYEIGNFAACLRKHSMPARLQTIRFISISVDKTKVSRTSSSFAVVFNPSQASKSTSRQYMPFWGVAPNSIRSITWVRVLNAVPTVEFVVRSRQTSDLLSDGLKRVILNKTTRTSKFIYWSSVNSLMLSPDFEVHGFGKSKVQILSRAQTSKKWVVENTAQKMEITSYCLENEDGWTKMEA